MVQKTTCFIALLFTLIATAQKVVVVDFDTNFPIQNCTIYSDGKINFVETDSNGEADLSIFKQNDIITFNHITYVEVDILKRHLTESNYRIKLHKRAESLDEVTLSVGRHRESMSRIAKQVEVNQLSQIMKRSPQTSADLLAKFPGVRVQKSQSGGGSPVLRGMEANRVLLVVDGVRLNNAIYRSGHLQNSITVAPTTLQRTEIIFGPSSVIYGSDALGGVIHYYTRTPKLAEETSSKAGIFSRYSSVNNEFTNQLNVEFGFKKWASFTSFTYSKFGDIKMGKNRNHGYDDWGKVFEYSNNTEKFYNPLPVLNADPSVQKNTAYDQYDFLQKFYFQLSENTDISVNIQHSNSSNIPRFDKLTEYSSGELKFAEWYYGPQERTLLSSQLNFEPNKSWLNNGTLTAAYQKIKESRINRKFTSLDKTFRNEHVDVFSLNGDFYVPFSSHTKKELSYGFEVVHNDVQSNAIGKTLKVDGSEIIGYSGTFNVQTRYPDGGSNYTSVAVYSNYRQDLNAKSTLNTGIRLTHTNLNAKWIDESFITLPENDIKLKNSAVTATLGHVYKPSKNWQLNSMLSSGFRSPNIDDVGKIREKSGKVTVPNVDLKPEYAYNAEIGILKYFDERKWSINLNVYYTLLNNYIAREAFLVDGSPTIIYDGEEVETYANVNHDNAYITGSTLRINGSFLNHFTTEASLTYTKGKGYDTGLPLSSIPPLFGNIGVSYSRNKFETGLNFRFNAAKNIDDYNLVEGIDNEEQSPVNSNGDYLGTPSWSTLNFYSKYDINKSISLQFMIDNIFDQHYKEFASAISAHGRNYSLSVVIN